MTMFKTGAIGCSFLAFVAQAHAEPIQPQTVQIGRPAVIEHVSAGRQVLEIDMSALTDPVPRRATTALASPVAATPAAAEPAAVANGTPQPRKRFAHKTGQYEDAPLAALLASTN